MHAIIAELAFQIFVNLLFEHSVGSVALLDVLQIEEACRRAGQCGLLVVVLVVVGIDQGDLRVVQIINIIRRTRAIVIHGTVHRIILRSVIKSIFIIKVALFGPIETDLFLRIIPISLVDRFLLIVFDVKASLKEFGGPLVAVVVVEDHEVGGVGLIHLALDLVVNLLQFLLNFLLFQSVIFLSLLELPLQCCFASGLCDSIIIIRK